MRLTWVPHIGKCIIKIYVDKCLTKCMSIVIKHMKWEQSPNESLYSNPSTFSTHNINNFFQITISEFFKRFKKIFIKLDRLSSKRLRMQFFINFLSEKLHSANAVKMGLVKHMVASLCSLGNNAVNMSWFIISSAAWIYHVLAAE